MIPAKVFPHLLFSTAGFLQLVLPGAVLSKETCSVGQCETRDILGHYWDCTADTIEQDSGRDRTPASQQKAPSALNNNGTALQNLACCGLRSLCPTLSPACCLVSLLESWLRVTTPFTEDQGLKSVTGILSMEHFGPKWAEQEHECLKSVKFSFSPIDWSLQCASPSLRLCVSVCVRVVALSPPPKAHTHILLQHPICTSKASGLHGCLTRISSAACKRLSGPVNASAVKQAVCHSKLSTAFWTPSISALL